MNRGSRGGQPFQVTFTLDNGHLPRLESQIISCSKLLMGFGVLSFKLNGHEMMTVNPCGQLNSSDNSPGTLQNSANISLNNPNAFRVPSEAASMSGISSPLTKESRGGKAILKRDAAKPTLWKEEPAFRVPYPPQAVAVADEKAVQKNMARAREEKTYGYFAPHNVASLPFDVAVASNINANVGQQINGMTKSRQSKRRKVQNEAPLPYYQAQHQQQTGYSQFPCVESNPACNSSFRMFEGKPSFEQPIDQHLHHQVYQQMPLVRQPQMQANRFYNYALEAAHNQMFPPPRFQPDPNYGFKQCLPAGTGSPPPPQTPLVIKEELCIPPQYENPEGRTEEEEKFMDTDSLARLIDSGEELPFSDCLDDLDGLLDFDLPEDLSVFETDPPVTGVGNIGPFGVFPEDEENQNSDGSLEAEVKPGSPYPEVGERGRKRSREEKQDDLLEADVPECNAPKKSTGQDRFQATASFSSNSRSPGNVQEEPQRHQMTSRLKEQQSRSQPHSKPSQASPAVEPDRSRAAVLQPESGILDASNVLASATNLPCPLSHAPFSSAVNNNTAGLNSSPRSCFTPSQYPTSRPQNGPNLSPSLASDSDGSPRLSTDDDRSSSGGKTASLLLSPPNWASDVSAPSGLEFYESSAFPRNDILTAEVGFTV